MNIQNVFELYSNLHNDNLSFVYQGNFDDKITDRIIDISESTIASKQEQHKISNKVSFLLAECFQNIIRHGDFHDGLSTIPAGIFVTRYINKSYYISSANLIANKYVEELRSKLELLNQMSPEDLKRLYIEVLTNNQLTNKGGAGLGLIEMARKSGQKLAFEFEEVDENYSYFYLQIKLKSPINDEGVNIDTNVAKDFHRMMAADNIFLIHKG